MKKYLSILVLLLIIFTLIGVVSATNSNTTEHNDNQQVVQENNNPTQTVEKNTQESDNTKNINKKNKTDNTKTEEELDEGCCTTIVQGENNDSSVSFRRDGTSKATINVKHNDTILKQYKTDGSYFFHIMISKNGWVVGTGGLEGTTTCKNIESYSLSMINNNNMSSYYLNKIYNIKAQSSLSHYVIKSPNGTFNLQIKRDGRIFKDSGVLKPGQYVVVPNKVPLYQRGTLKNFRDTEKTMLNYSRYLSSHDKYGIQRRQILTYYYKNNIVNSTIKVIVANDNGRHVGVRSAQYVDNVQTNTRFISSSNIPVLDNSLDVDKVNFFIRKTKTSVTTKNMTINTGKVELTATIKDEFGQKVQSGKVSFNIDGKTLKYSNGKIKYAKVVNGTVKYSTSISNLWNRKSHTYYINYIGSNNYQNSKSSTSNIKVDNFFKIKTIHKRIIYYGEKISIKSTVKYNQNNSKVNGGKIFYKINGKTVLNSKNTTLYKKVNEGQAEYNHTFDSKYWAKNYTITTVYINGAYRKEYKTHITILKMPAKITSAQIKLSENTIHVTGKLVNRYNKPVKYSSYIKIKINGKTLKNNNTIRKFYIKNGAINFKFTIPREYRSKTYKLEFIIPEFKQTLSYTKNYTIKV